MLFLEIDHFQTHPNNPKHHIKLVISCYIFRSTWIKIWNPHKATSSRNLKRHLNSGPVATGSSIFSAENPTKSGLLCPKWPAQFSAGATLRKPRRYLVVSHPKSSIEVKFLYFRKVGNYIWFHGHLYITFWKPWLALVSMILRMTNAKGVRGSPSMFGGG